jgi:hypothetical protein
MTHGSPKPAPSELPWSWWVTTIITTTTITVRAFTSALGRDGIVIITTITIDAKQGIRNSNRMPCSHFRGAKNRKTIAWEWIVTSNWFAR